MAILLFAHPLIVQMNATEKCLMSIKKEAESSGLPVAYAYFCGLNNVDPFSND